MPLGTAGPERRAEAVSGSRCGPEPRPAQVWSQPGGGGELGPLLAPSAEAVSPEQGRARALSAHQATWTCSWSSSQTSPKQARERRGPSNLLMEMIVTLRQQKWCGWATRSVRGSTGPRAECLGSIFPAVPRHTPRHWLLGQRRVAWGPALLTPSKTGQRWPICPPPKPVTSAFQGAQPGPPHHTASSGRLHTCSSPASTGGEPEFPEPWGSPASGGSAPSRHQRLWWRPEPAPQHGGQRGGPAGGPYRSRWWAAPGASCGS